MSLMRKPREWICDFKKSSKCHGMGNFVWFAVRNGKLIEEYACSNCKAKLLGRPLEEW